jgi:uncharacterized membrane protein YkoI
MMKRNVRNYFVLSAMGSLMVVGPAALAEDDIDLAEVPANVMAAANAAVDDIQIMEAEVEEKNGQTIYELEGKANGVEYEIEVAADGTVRKVEEDD